MRRFGLALLVAPLFLASTALAATDVPLPPFTGINVHGGAHAILRHGPSQHVTLIKGDLKISELKVVNGGTLDISPCPVILSCPSHYELEVEIVSPDIRDIEAHGGGLVQAAGNFPKQPKIAAEAHGGGVIDIRAIPVDAVNANAHGGGAIRTAPVSVLNANAHGGGSITFTGHPQINSNVHGGGSVSNE
jgi:hypothetical protein